jgi:hypothetical protein
MGTVKRIGGRANEDPTSGARGRGLVLAGITELEGLRECMVVQPEDILDLSERCRSMVEGVVAPLSRSGDLEGARFDEASGRVAMPTVAYLVGEQHRGVDVLLPLLNTSRILTGMEGLAIGASASSMAHRYAAEGAVSCRRWLP